MSLKENISIWNEAVLLFESGEYDEAIEKFRQVPEQSAKIVFNIGCLLLLKNSFHSALICFSEAVEKDPYLAVALFQRGCTNVHLRCYSDAKHDFQSSLEKMRGGEIIDYRQLGLSLKLFASQVLMNLALVNHQTGDTDEAVHCIQRASRLLKHPHHEAVIVSALGSLPNIDVKLIEIPLENSVFRPPKSAVANLKKKDFLGKATDGRSNVVGRPKGNSALIICTESRVVSSVAKNDSFVGFDGARKCSSSPNSPSPTKKQAQLTVDNVKVKRGALTPPPPGRSRPIIAQAADRLQSMPKRPPPQLSGSRSSDIQKSRSSEILTPSSTDKNVVEFRSSDVHKPMMLQSGKNLHPVPKRPPPVLNGSRSAEMLKSNPSDILKPKPSEVSKMSRPPPPNYPPPFLKRTSEGSEVKVKPPRPPLPVVQKRL